MSSEDKSKFISNLSVYTQAPPENAMIFLLDLNNSSFQSKMIYYFVAVAKEILAKPEFD